MQRFNKLQPTQESLNILFINVGARLRTALFQVVSISRGSGLSDVGQCRKPLLPMQPFFVGFFSFFRFAVIFNIKHVSCDLWN